MSAMEPPALRPMTLGQLLDRAFRLYRQNFLTFVGIIAAMVIPVYGINLIISLLNIPQMLAAAENMSYLNYDDPWQAFATQMQASGVCGAYLVAFLSFILVQGIATAALVKAIEDRYLGRPADILGSYGKISKVVGPLLVVLFFEGLLFVALLIWTIIPCIGWFTGTGMLIFVGSVIFPLVSATFVIENQRGFGAIQRAWELARRRFWWVFGYIIVLYVLNYILTLGPSILLGIATGYFQQSLSSGSDAFTQMAIQTGLAQVTQIIGMIIYLPIQITAITLMYFDLRVRTEGFDMAVLTAGAPVDGESETTVPTTPQAPTTTQGSIITGTEIAYFFGLSIAPFALCGILYGGILLITMLVFGVAGGL